MHIEEHRTDVTRTNPTSDLLENRRTFLFKDLSEFPWGMATRAPEFTDENPTTEISFGQTAARCSDTFITSNSRPFGDLLGIEWYQPNVSVSHRIAVILKIQRAIAGILSNRGRRG